LQTYFQEDIDMESYGDVDLDRPIAGSDAEREANRLMERIGDITRDLDQRTRTFVREYPTAAVLSAVAIGFVFGRLLVRR
jgi:ElaB/YqjD/DUF883 family membrane-anchored ribosome-binding protein